MPTRKSMRSPRDRLDSHSFSLLLQPPFCFFLLGSVQEPVIAQYIKWVISVLTYHEETNLTGQNFPNLWNTCHKIFCRLFKRIRCRIQTIVCSHWEASSLEIPVLILQYVTSGIAQLNGVQNRQSHEITWVPYIGYFSSTANIRTGNIRQGKFSETGNVCENFLYPNFYR